jgi:mono/diheme cytochrome c family protein
MQARLSFFKTGAVALLLFTPGAFGQIEGVYQDQCASCHATDGVPTEAGKKLGAMDLRSPFVQDLTDEELFNGIAFGTGHRNYPHAYARRGVTEQQIHDLVEYIRNLPRRR